MPENEFPKLVPHPFRAFADAAPVTPHTSIAPIAELCVTTNYTFLTGASHPEEMVRHAAALGYSAVAITDTNSLAGIVRAHVAAKECGIHLLIGSRLRLQDLPHASLFLYAVDMPTYRQLCRLLTIGKRRAPKGECHLTIADVAAHTSNHCAILMMDPGHHADVLAAIDALHFLTTGDRLSIALTHAYALDDDAITAHYTTISRETAVPLVATCDVHYHIPQRRMLQDVLTCIRHTCTLPQAGYHLHPNSERYFKPTDEIQRLYREHPAAIQRALDLASRARGFTLDQLRYEYPDEVVPPGKTAMAHLRDLTWQGARDRYPDGIPSKVINHLNHELTLIEELNYAPYFLTVHDLVNFARSRTPPILCQGRGAAANSAVCYCLGVTSVDPTRIDLLFERFISKERNEPPDVDIDFEHERREEDIQYIYTKYGRDRAALTAEVISYRRRCAVRDVGKALGLSLDLVDRLAKDMDWWDAEGLNPDRLREMGLDPADPTIVWLGVLTRDILGFPRHLSQHVGGFVITRSPLCELVPVENAAMPDRTVIEWDKDDIDALGMLKIDILALGMLTCIRKALELVNSRRQSSGHAPVELHSIPPNDPAVYDMICRADTIGVFQIESRAQMSMLPRLRPRCFYDLVIEVAIVRPGPIHGNMVHPYLKRRSGKEKVHFPDEQVKAILGKTLGVPIFQEQAMRLAIVLADFSPGEAEKLRRAMAAWKRNKEVIATFKQKIVAGMTRNGYSVEFAETCMEQIKGFSEYGFPESHAASFALLVYASAWLKHHYPAEFAAALLNSQPMGFYAPAQIVRDAQDHGVCVREADIAYSGWDTRLEEDDTSRRPAVRLGLRLFKGLPRHETELLVDSRERHPTSQTIEEFWLKVTHDYAEAPERPYRATLQIIARGDGFRSFGLTRREALWAIKALPEIPLPVDRATLPYQAPPAARAFLPATTTQQEMFADYAATGLSLKGHPIGFIRHELDRRRVSTARALKAFTRLPRDRTVAVAGVAIIRQRPGTAKGVVFITLEDETGITNLIIRPEVFEKYRRIVLASSSLLATGSLERIGEVIYINTIALEAIDDRIAGAPQETNSYSYR